MKTRYLFLIFSFCFCYCTPNNRYKEIVHEMHGKEIVFPEGLKKWRENGFDHNVAYDYQDKKRKIVVYFSSLTCNVCNLGKTGNWKKLEKEFKNVEFIYILSSIRLITLIVLSIPPLSTC